MGILIGAAFAAAFSAIVIALLGLAAIGGGLWLARRFVRRMMRR